MMKGSSKVIMGATLAMVVSLAIVVGLILALLAELYCSLLLRRRRFKNISSNSAATAQTTTPSISSNYHTSNPQDQFSSPSSLSSFYAQGVLQAPRSILFPITAPPFKDDILEPKKQHPHELHDQVVDIQQAQESNPGPKPTKLLSTFSPPPSADDKTGSGKGLEHLVYISNPIYDNAVSRPNTPFETPDTSPSCLEASGSSEDEEAAEATSASPPIIINTPPLSPMKRLPSEACCVSLRDITRSLVSSGSGPISNNGLSSSSSASPCTSPSW